MKENLIQQKSYDFAVKIVNLYKYLIEIKKEFVLSKQLLRCGTSVGANVEEAIGGQSRNDFIAKLSIAYKEARETKYWLSLLKDTKYINQEEFSKIVEPCEEILRIIGKIQKTMKKAS
ncbi:MAG: four helix bundle protein [Candidatus Parcubacteria bacterium]|nr:four helix bundle protein [Candidatus Parcubacteria bacterium]